VILSPCFCSMLMLCFSASLERSNNKDCDFGVGILEARMLLIAGRNHVGVSEATVLTKFINLNVGSNEPCLES
jgi:hypothetical protein